MIVLDAYALVGMLAGGAAERPVRDLLDGGDVGVATVNLIEVFDVVERVRGVPAAEADRVITPLLGSVLAVLPLDLVTARNAARIRIDHYHRADCPLSLADCVLLASGASGDAVATADPHVLRIAELVDRRAVPLPGGG